MTYSSDFSSITRPTFNWSGEDLARPERRLSFGDAPPLGTVTIMSRESFPEIRDFEEYARATARFDVIVPAGLAVRLTVERRWCDAHEFERFATWPPDALDELSLLDCSVGDPAIRHLAGLRGLRYLDLYGTHASDVSGPVIGGLGGLEWLSLSFTRFGDAGVADLVGLTNLGRLSLRGTAVTDAAIPALAAIPHVEVLSLADTAVTATGVARLIAGSRSLRFLAINGTPAQADGPIWSLHHGAGGVEFFEH